MKEVRVRVRVGGGMRYLRTEKHRSFHLRPFIVLTITKRAHYKAERETTCSMNVLKVRYKCERSDRLNPFHMQAAICRGRGTASSQYSIV